MKLAIGMLVSPRPAPTYKKCIESLTGTGVDPILFSEPGCCINRTDHLCVQRPEVKTEKSFFTHSPTGVFGNFGNYIQTGRDLLEISEDADAILIAEDDALFAPNIYELLQRDLWPSLDCGVVSLYCPKMNQYSTAHRGLNKTRITTGKQLTTAGNLVGALALVFPRSVLQEIAYHPSVETWKGSHGQASNPNTKPWERKAVDTWIGQVLKQMGKTAWHYAPSLVYHYSPDPKVANSSLGHGTSNRNRQARSWVGEKPQDLLALMQPLKERYDIPCADLSEHPV